MCWDLFLLNVMDSVWRISNSAWLDGGSSLIMEWYMGGMTMTVLMGLIGLRLAKDESC